MKTTDNELKSADTSTDTGTKTTAVTSTTKEKKQPVADKEAVVQTPAKEVAKEADKATEKKVAKVPEAAQEVKKPVKEQAVAVVEANTKSSLRAGEKMRTVHGLRVYESSVSARPAFVNTDEFTIADGTIHQGRVRVILENTRGLKNCWVNANELSK